MNKNLNFKPGHYKITKIIEPNVIELEETWFIKLKGVSDRVPKEEIKKWLKEGNIVRIIPYRRNDDARIISDVWLGNTHINRQFSHYKIDNFIQAFEYWKNLTNSEQPEAEDELIEAFHRVESEISSFSLKNSFKQWLAFRGPQKRVDSFPPSVDEIIEKREQSKKQMIQDFDEWRKQLYG